MENTPINYEEKVVSQLDLVKKLTEDYKSAPADEKKFKLQQETDILRHYLNAVKENPKERSKKIYNFAKTEALNQAVQQIPEES